VFAVHDVDASGKVQWRQSGMRFVVGPAKLVSAQTD
jgi:hypothetical protein